MSSVFGNSGTAEAEERQATARQTQQSANEEAGRAQQQAERGSSGGRGRRGRRGRDMLIGSLSGLKQTLGG